MLEAGIQQLVVADAAVQAIIGSRFYPVLVPEDAKYPCASYQVISSTPIYRLADSKASGAALETRRLQVDTWSGGVSSATYGAVKQAQAAIRAVLELFRGELPDGTLIAGIFVVNAMDTFEQDSRSYRTTTDFMVTFYPATSN